ncbi:hypothetical protein MLN87_07365 [Escherichia coli]|nr:hypothetical protein [Escherichia coli]MCN8204082.1 hypothetical protein [Escherichia coli]HAI3384504.1 hypothetical protein [Escherichia coli]HAL0004642.1 hypothetical protein [Escherichia coli]HAP1523984.1 hypothetical protein [Escherichia coli]
MQIHKEIKFTGDKTDCAPLDLCSYVWSNVQLWQATPLEEMQKRLTEDFEELDRAEYRVTDDSGNTLAVMVIVVDERDRHTGKPVIQPLIAFSKIPGLLTPAYRWMIQLAKAAKIEWYLTTKQDISTGDEVIRWRKIKP